jgi:lipid-A-disaccharide synthase-like uncharacterized protein
MLTRLVLIDDGSIRADRQIIFQDLPRRGELITLDGVNGTFLFRVREVVWQVVKHEAEERAALPTLLVDLAEPAELPVAL